MWVYVCVYAHTHTHFTDGVISCDPRTSQMGYSVVSPGVGMRHLEGPGNHDHDGLNLGVNIFVYVYKVHMCMYMLEAG